MISNISHGDQFWRCRVKMAAYIRRRYDNDPVFRIERNLRRCKQYRTETVKRRKERLNATD